MAITGVVPYGGSIDRSKDEGVFSYSVTRRVISGYELLAPLIPSSIICIGLNYRKHAEESGAKLPEHPIVFMKFIEDKLKINTIN